MQTHRRTIFLALLFHATFALSQTSRDFAVMGRSTWSAFECSVLASHVKNTKEQERLFKFAYREGLTFISALQANRIDRKDISEEVPMGFVWLLQGPNPDFILGRVYEAAQEEALRNVLKTAQQLNSEETQKLLAQSEFSKRNCGLIGGRK